ncbi:MAG: type I 3-dehydroquinate dehydratase [Candidatus Bathyarchaeia archaeon]|nr:type I 3-dehydroquinate dehydratase [Candidatus Bathyarchaeota archaeon]
MTVRICVSIMPKSFNDALKLIQKAEEHKANFIEIRLDCLGGFKELKDVAGCAKTPLIATIRTPNCGGNFLGKDEERRKILYNAASNGFKYVDIELDTPWLSSFVKELHALGVKPILSFHDFEETPEITKLQQILKNEIAVGADICKIVTMARSLQDNLTLLRFLNEEGGKAKIVCFAMGALGKPSRLLSPIFGGYFTIAALEHGGETASGQMTIQEMKAAYKALGAM